MLEPLRYATPDRRFPLLDLAVLESCIRREGAPRVRAGCWCVREARIRAKF